MLADYQRLRKILELERNKGYQDKAVIGGLDKFLEVWLGRVAEKELAPSILTQLKRLRRAKSGYRGLSTQQREKWVSDFLSSLSEPSGQPPPISPSKAKQVAKKPPQTANQEKSPNTIDLPVTAVHGISTSLAAKFAKLGVHTVRDLLYFFPHRHLDYSQVKHIADLNEGDEETIVANVWQAREVSLGGRRSTEAIVGDETGNVRVVWFNNPYLAKKFATNTRLIVSGQVGMFQGRPVFQSPEWELVGDESLIHTGRLVPLYSLTQGLRPRQVRKIMKAAVDEWLGVVSEFLPEGIRKRRGLLGLPQAISQAHYPADEASKTRARERLAFDELFLLQLGVLGKKRDWQESQPGNPFRRDTGVLDNFLKSLPFELTPAQHRVLGEVLNDLEKPRPMSRLLQGEVGSGKTVVAAAALLTAVASGYQAALMAPTEILAEQHLATVRKLLSRAGDGETEDGSVYSYSGLLDRPVTVALLIGDVGLKKKQKLRQRILDGDIDIVIGTQALIQKGVEYHKLGLAVIDEQHRFGVAQRSALRQKGFNPHVLVMTATPIPRTLALTLYGDLDLSVIDQLPRGRQAIKTKWLRAGQRPSAYAFLRRQVAEGRQTFIICPLVEESEVIQARAATAEYERLSREVFPDLKLGLVHGRLSAKDKDKTMRSFHGGELDILVSTAVVEVGIDVPNATVMLVESADRFGLSQLHQFRGRVGRGEHQSYCMLMAQNPTEVARARLDIIDRVNDGFQLAEEDLKLRGPGEFFGTRQSGLPDLKMARLTDVALLEKARWEAIKLFEADPQLKNPAHKLLRQELARVWPRENGEWS